MKPLPPSLWDVSLQHIIDDMQGRPIQVHCLLANHPSLLKAWWGYRMHSVRVEELQSRDRELVILRVAVHMKAWYEWAAHVDRGLAAGLTLTQIYRVAEGPSAAAWSEKDSMLLNAVDQLIAKHRIDDATQQRIGKHFSEKQIMDVISLQGLYTTIACLIGTWPVDIEEHILERLPNEVTEKSFRALLLATNRD